MGGEADYSTAELRLLQPTDTIATLGLLKYKAGPCPVYK